MIRVIKPVKIMLQLKIRLMRVGKRNQPSYRIIITEARSKRDGKYVESLSNWNPKTNELKNDKKRYYYWLNHGAQPTLRVRKLHEKAA